MSAVGPKTTLGRLLDEWLDKLDPGLAHNTREGYTKRVEKQIRPALGDVRLDELNTHMIDTFYKRPTDEGLSPRLHGDTHRLRRGPHVRSVADHGHGQPTLHDDGIHRPAQLTPGQKRDPDGLGGGPVRDTPARSAHSRAKT